MSKQDNFVAPDRMSVIIPYSDLEKMVKVVQKMEEMERQYKRIEDQYAAIRGMFSECLEKIREIQQFVQD